MTETPQTFMAALAAFDEHVIALAATTHMARADAAIEHDHDARRRWLAELSAAVRLVSDALDVPERIAKSEAPPVCDLRVRRSNARPGQLTDVNEYLAGWLVLASKDGHVLEIYKPADEWSDGAAERFARACSAPADVKLAEMLAAGEGSV